MPNRLLLADGDPKSLRVLDVSLRSAGFIVETATTGVEAWAILQRGLPDVVIAASDLQSIDGFDLCGRLRGHPDGASLPFILLGADATVESKVKGLQVGSDEYLVKPVLVNDMVARVLALVRRRDRDKLASTASSTTPLSGKLTDLTPVDLLETVAAGNRSGIIHLRDRRGSPGTVYFRRGVVVDAEVGRLSGPEAIGRLLSWSQGTFEVEWKNIRRPDAIGKPTAELVLDGMRRLDDWNQLAAEVPDMHDVFEVNYPVLADRLAEIPDEVNSVLRLFDGVRSLDHVVEDSTLADLDALGMVIRLRDEGIIRNVTHRAPARNRSSDGERVDAAPNEVSTRLSSASRAVEQSFANRMAAEDGDSSGATGERTSPVEPGPPPPPMTRTAPGLGEPMAERTEEPGAVPQPRQSEAGVGHQPDETEGDIDSGEEAFALAGAAEQVESQTDEPVREAPPLEERGHAPTPDQVRALHHTQRGLGPVGLVKPRADGVSSETLRPVSLPGVAPAPSLFSEDDIADLVADSVASQPASPATTPESRSGTFPPTLILTPPNADSSGPKPAAPPPATLMLPPPSTGDDGVISANQAVRADETVRVSFPDETLSHREALDELGLSGRGRVLRVLSMALAVGVLAGVVIHRLRTPSVATGDATAPTAEGTAPASPPSGGPGTTEAPAGQRAGEPLVVPAGRGSAPAMNPELADHAAGKPAEAAGEQAAPSTGPSGSPPVPAVGAQGPAGLPAASAESSKGASVARAETGTADPHGKPPHERPGSSGPEAPAGEPGASGHKPAAAAPPHVENTEASAKPVPPPSLAKSSSGATGAGVAAAPAAAVPDQAAAPLVDFARQLSDCRTQFLKNKLREAAATCAAALQTNPRSADALTLMAHVELNRSHLNRANELAQKAVSIDPRQADAYVIIGGVHQDNGRIPQAKAAYAQYLELAPHGRYADELRSIIGNL